MNLVLRCWDQVLRVVADNPQVIEHVSSIRQLASIPVAVVPDSLTRIENEPCLVILEGHPPMLQFDSLTNSIMLQVAWNEINTSDTIENLLGQLLSLSCLNNSVFPLHAAAVSLQDSACLLIGGSGAGKTVLSVALSKRRAFKWISNDWTGLSTRNGKVEVSKGNDLINFRKLSLPQLQFTFSAEHLRKIQRRFPRGSLPWVKSAPPFRAAELELPEAILPVDLKAVFFTSLGHGEKDFCREMPQSTATVSLLKELSWPLKGLGSSVLSNSGHALYPGVATSPERGWTELCGFVNAVVSQCSVWVIEASIDVAADFVMSVLTRQ